MTVEDLKKYKEKLSKLSEKEKELRNIYLRKIAQGEISGPLTGYPSVDKPWYRYYDDLSINASLPKMTAYEFMYSRNKDNQNDVAINYFGNKIKYKNFFNKIEETAKALQANGVKKGDIVTICSITTPEVVYLFYALNRLGAVANMIDPRVNEDRIIEIINNSNSKLVFTLNLIYPKIEKMKDSLNSEKYVVLSAYDSLLFPLNVIKNRGKDIPKINKNENITWKKFISEGKTIDILNTISYEENMPAGIVYTGGTTGVPKGAVLSNENFNGMALNYTIGNLGVRRQQTVLDIMPPFIAYGMNTGLHMPLSLGVTVIIIPKFEPEKFPDLIIKHKPNNCLGVPSHFDILTKSEKLKNADLSFIMYPAVGGDAMNNVLEENLNKFLTEHNCAARITKGYGMTELSGAAITSGTNFNKLGSVGIPFPLNSVGIFKPGTDEELPKGQIGEVCMKGPTMMLGYLNNEEEEAKVKKVHSDGTIWVHSQDYGYIDNDGFLFVKGRMKRTIVRPDGHNNYPLEIENVINTFEGVCNSAVVDFDARKIGNGHIPVAFVVLEDKNKNIKSAGNPIYKSKYSIYLPSVFFILLIVIYIIKTSYNNFF